MDNWTTILRAVAMAAHWHVHQRRKGSKAEPYINHLLEVAVLVAEATSGSDPNLVIAALFHDSIEDHEVPVDVILEFFGEDVATLVEEVTDNKRLPKEERKRLQIETASCKSDRVKILKLADKISNMRSLAFDPPTDWSIGRRLEYVRWARDVGRGLAGISVLLDREFELAARKAELSTTLRNQ